MQLFATLMWRSWVKLRNPKITSWRRNDWSCLPSNPKGNFAFASLNVALKSYEYNGRKMTSIACGMQSCQGMCSKLCSTSTIYFEYCFSQNFETESIERMWAPRVFPLQAECERVFIISISRGGASPTPRNWNYENEWAWRRSGENSGYHPGPHSCSFFWPH